MHTLRAAALLALLSTTQDNPPIEPLRHKITLSLDAPLATWLDSVRKEAGASIVLDPRTGDHVDLDRKIRLNLHHITIANALRWIAAAAHCDVHIKGDVVTVRPAELGGTEGFLPRTYPAPAAGQFLPDQPGGRVELPADPLETTLQVTPPVRLAPQEGDSFDELLLDLIKSNIAPGTWEGAQTLERVPQNRLIATAPERVHREIAWLLEALDRSHGNTITVAVTIADAESGLAPGPVAPAEIEPLLRRLRKSGARESDLSALPGHQAHSASHKETVGVAAYARGEAVQKSRVAEALILDARPCIADGGRALQVTLRLSTGRTREYATAGARAGKLPLQERLATRLATTLLVPDGGGVLLALPAHDSRPQLCLVRATSTKPGPEAPRKLVLAPGGDSSGTAERLAKAPAAALDLDQASLDDFAAWLRRTAGLTVLLPSDPPADAKITLHSKAITPLAALPLVLEPLGLGHVAHHEAVQIAPLDAVRKFVRLGIFDIRDLATPPPDFSRHEDLAVEYTPEDLANLVKNTVHQDSWEEADGKSIMTHQGVFYVRNSEAVLADIVRFLDGQRATDRKRVSLRAEILDAPAEAVDAALENRAAKSMLLEPGRRDRLLAAGRLVERLEWPSYDQQRTLLEWDRARDTLHESDAATATLRSAAAASYLELRPALMKDKETFEVALEFRGRHFLEGSSAAEEHAIKTTVEIPGGRTALFRSTSAGRSRLLLLTPSVIP